MISNSAFKIHSKAYKALRINAFQDCYDPLNIRKRLVTEIHQPQIASDHHISSDDHQEIKENFV